MQSYRPVNVMPNDASSFAFLSHPNPPSQPNAHYGPPYPFSHPQTYHQTNTFQTENRSNNNKSITFTSRNPKEEYIPPSSSHLPMQGFYNYNKAQVTIGNNNAQRNHQSNEIHDEKKYTSRAPLEQPDRTSIGLGIQQAYDPRKHYRRSESLYKLRYPEIQKETAGKGYITSYRDVTQYIKSNQPVSISNNFQFKTNSSNFTDISQPDPSRSSNKPESPFISLFSKYEESPPISTNSNTQTKQFNYKAYLDEIRSSGSSHQELVPVRKQSTQCQKYVPYDSNKSGQNDCQEHQDKVKRQSSNDKEGLNAKYTKKLNTISRDIQALKNATKQSKEVYEKEIQKNTYLSKLLQKRASRNSNEENSDWHVSQVSVTSREQKGNLPKKEPDLKNEKLELQKKIEQSTIKLQATNRQLQIQIIELQRQLEQKNKELSLKNNEIWDKSKIIIEKNKTIDTISNELRQSKQIISSIEDARTKQQEMKDTIARLQEENNQAKAKAADMEQSTEEILKFLEKEKDDKSRIDREYSQKISQLNEFILDLNNRVELLAKQKNSFAAKVEQLRVTQSQSSIQLFEVKSQLIAREKQIMVLTAQLEEFHSKKKEKEMISIAVQAIESDVEDTVLDLQEQRQAEGSVESKETKQDLLVEELRRLEQVVASYRAREKQIAHLLLDEGASDHSQILTRLNQLLERSKDAEGDKAKQQQRIQQHQLYRMHHDYLEKKCQQMNRQLKRAGNKLIGVSNEAHQGWRLLNDYNSEIILLNLANLNEKYRSLECQSADGEEE